MSASVEQVRGQINAAKEQAERGAAMLGQVEAEVTQGMQAFQEAAQGSSQSEAGDATAMFTAALQKLDEAREMLLRAASGAETYGSRL